jgi:hypothetical protein
MLTMPRLSSLALVVVGLLAFDVAAARAQTPPPATTPPAQPTPPPIVTPPPAGDAVVPLGQLPPPAESAPPAMPGAAPPPPQASPPYAPSAAIAIAPVPAPLPPDRPFYKKRWFWGAVGVFVVTGLVIGYAVTRDGGPSKPNTTLGDMRAF